MGGDGNQVSRLDGLIALLENGTSGAVRRMAAEQVGELVAAHPAQAKYVLKRVRRLLRSVQWDTRIAGGHAIRAIADQTPTMVVTDEPDELQKAEWQAEEATFLRFEQLDLAKLIENGMVLLGSSGEEYSTGSIDISIQRSQLKRDLGIDDRLTGGEDGLGVKDEDLILDSSIVSQEPAGKQKADEFVAELGNNAHLSKREAHRLKREAQKKRRAGADFDEPASSKRTKGQGTDGGKDTQAEAEEDGDSVVPWLFASTCRELKEGLLQEKWEFRHGATVGLREILKKHAGSAGTVSPKDAGKTENSIWLEDVACRLLCVLALDRFGDFVGDGVVAPVRETACMALAAAAKAMNPEQVSQLLGLLQVLQSASNKKHWEVRHGALLGVKYLLSVSSERLPELLPTAFASALEGLEDEDDDVRAVSCDAISPAMESVWTILPHQVNKLVSVTWASFYELDELSASTASLMRLVSRIYTTADVDSSRADHLVVSKADEDDSDDNSEGLPQGNKTLEMSELVPRLFPFFRHRSTKVRRAAVEAFQSLIIYRDSELSFKWLEGLCGTVIDKVFRNLLLEYDAEALATSQEIWKILTPKLTSTEKDSALVARESTPFLKDWFELACCESRTAAIEYDKALRSGKESKQRRKPKKPRKQAKAQRRPDIAEDGEFSSEAIALDSSQSKNDPEDAILMQLSAATGFGVLAVTWPSDDDALVNILLDGIKSPYAIPRRNVCFIAARWFQSGASLPSEELIERITVEVSGDGGCLYAELNSSVSSLFTDVRSLLEAYQDDCSKDKLVALGTDVDSLSALVSRGLNSIKENQAATVAQVAADLQEPTKVLATAAYEYWETTQAGKSGRNKKREVVSSVRMHVLATIGYQTERRNELRTSLIAAAAVAVIANGSKPLPKLVSVYIKALMNSLRTLDSAQLQSKSASSIASLLRRLGERKTLKPVTLVIKNLCKFVTESREKAPEEGEPSTTDSTKVEHRGTGMALRALGKEFGDDLFSSLPWLWDTISNPVLAPAMDSPENILSLTTALVVLRVIVSDISAKPRSKVASLFPALVDLCAIEDESMGSEAGRCLSELVFRLQKEGMNAVVRNLVPLLGQDRVALSRRNAAKALRRVVKRLDTSLIPYAAFLVVPMMMRMVDQDQDVRDASAGVFGTLVRLMPLEEGSPDDPDMSESMKEERQEAREFLGQLLGSRPRTHYQMPVQIGDDVQLRHYQQECLDWLFFLNRYGLHGALCDDMGLGKTLMTLCVMAGDNHSLRSKGLNKPSLVVCPSTIVGHWNQEALRFFGKSSLQKVVMYLGSPRVREGIRQREDFNQADLVVTSYEALASDLEHFRSVRWNYQVLDEGHVIKNPKTRAAKAVRCISASHRLLLSGTPIQNTVLELWAIVDFLMPGFLGSEKSFKETYGKPILASRDAKCTDKQRENGMAAMEALHRQVLPFVLRRLKDDVLSELPPKVIQDYYCDMTPLQMRLYESFSKATLKDGVLAPEDMDEDMGDEPEKSKRGNSAGHHIFQALQYLKRLCSHPAMVVTPKHNQYESISQELSESGSSIRDVKQSPKLMALEQLLGELGIGDEEVLVNKETGSHRVLIFSQVKEMLTLVEEDLFKARMPRVTYLRMDGSVEPTRRHSIVTRFNADPTIDCLLMTTHVGGLGLNLTAADVVIFLEHDWNPTKDLQAMDRAHRIGQKKTVNVYRLIMRGTLEEKIMNVQRFKTHIANAVVNKDNSSLTSMNTSELLSLFKVEDEAEADASGALDGDATDGFDVKSKGLKNVVDQLGDLWDEKQYEDEYNLDEFAGAVGGGSGGGGGGG
eukprot:CAMPEP_0113964986 /NCGR_PEP_ID=MMETSP0011_2-20120614/7486_1 /TAXON_ID=101924 /ORGANISM="Rhodosorus marinus" /LENGTH=1812 /DNA_ID=CAMNT_0000977433 /DNA_START=209 /DNA_END=5643 /DNA_ORIENTATION=- /assembly_acc=CAM_ASM_000156